MVHSKPWLLLLSLAIWGCDDPPKEKPSEPGSADSAAKPEPPPAPPKPSAPTLFIDEHGPRAGMQPSRARSR